MGDHFIAGVDAVKVGDPGFSGTAFFIIVAEQEAAIHLPTHAFQRSSGQYAFGGAARAHIHVDAGFRVGAMHHTGHVAVGDQTDGSTCGAHFCDHVGVAGALKDANCDIRSRAALGAGQRFDAFAGGHVERYHIGVIARANRQLVHIGVGRVQHRAAWAHGDHGQRIGHVLGGQRGAFERVQRDVHAGAIAGADFFADVKHRGFVTLAFADHHDARDVEHVKLFAHRVDGGLVGGFLITLADQLGRGQRGGFGNAGEAEREHAVLKFGGSGHGVSSGAMGFLSCNAQRASGQVLGWGEHEAPARKQAAGTGPSPARPSRQRRAVIHSAP